MAHTISIRPISTSRHGGAIVRWVPPLVLAAVFAGGGLAKLAGDPAMVAMFTDIGAGQWLRYVVGALEVAGAVGLLIPRLAGLAAVGIAALMVGATLTNVFILDTTPAVTVGLLLIAGFIAWSRRTRLQLPLTAPTR